MYKFLVFAAAVAAANAGFIHGPAVAPVAVAHAAPAVATYAAHAPVVAHAAPVAYTAPAAIASPAVVSQHSNILRTPGNLGQISTYSKSIQTPHSSVTKSDIRVSNDALAYHAAPVAVAHAAPVVAAAAPAVVAHAAPAVATYAAHAAPVAAVAAAPAVVAHAAPVATVAHAAPAVAVGHTLGVAYSAAPVASHISFEGIGTHYEY